MRILENYEPREVLSYFEAISAIPHGSTNTRAIRDYCVKFAEQHALEHYYDDSDNVIIIKEATPGYEKAEPVILQGHLDMVCEKDAGCPRDMEHEGLELAVENGEVLARGTTLGADDGIAVAMMLALLAADDLPHPRLEAVFTSDEEIGMLGAAALDPTPLRGRRLLNIDSEEEGVFTVSCAGGNVTTCLLPLKRCSGEGEKLLLTVGGLKGGHSGNEIDKGLGNSNLLMGRLLYALQGHTPFSLVSVEGGLKDNAIPRETRAVLLTKDPAAVEALAAEWNETFACEFRATDPEVFVHAEREGATICEVLEESTARKAICLLHCLPNGIQSMSHDLPGLVQTSLNLGILKTELAALSLSFCVRSSVATEKEMLTARLRCLTEELGGRIEIAGDYPAWEFRKESPLRSLMEEIYREQYHKEPKVEAIHAGVECGLLCGKIPGLDCVSIGPELSQIHTPRERMNLASVQRVWAYVLEVLRRMN